MAGAVIGALRVILGADSAALEKDLKGAQQSLDKFAANVAHAGRVAAAGFALAAAGLSVAIKGTINEADKLFKMSQKFGIPIEELSALKHAADLSGVSLESLGKALAKLLHFLVCHMAVSSNHSTQPCLFSGHGEPGAGVWRTTKPPFP